MNYSNFKIKYISDADIEQAAYNLLTTYNSTGTLDVPVEFIIESGLKLDVIPLPLYDMFGISGFLNLSQKSIYLDDEQYMNHYSASKFTMAHELGHVILHSPYFDQLQIDSPESFIAFQQSIDEKQYIYIETQANKFAAALLMPKENLIIAAREYITTLKTVNLVELEKNGEIGFDGICDYISIPISRRLGVSNQACKNRLKNVFNSISELIQ